jgi:hypothetical protein
MHGERSKKRHCNRLLLQEEKSNFSDGDSLWILPAGGRSWTAWVTLDLVSGAHKRRPELDAWVMRIAEG